MCGMLHCDHRNEKLMLWSSTLAFSLPDAWVLANGMRYDCKGAILDVGLRYRDPGLVPTGTKCGEGKVRQMYIEDENHILLWRVRRGPYTTVT